MLTLKEVRRTTWAAVSQFEAKTTDGRSVFIHYKHGLLRVWAGVVGQRPQDALDSHPVLQMEHGDEHDFDITWTEISRLTGIEAVGAISDPYDNELSA